jgi:hypothetical protein
MIDYDVLQKGQVSRGRRGWRELRQRGYGSFVPPPTTQATKGRLRKNRAANKPICLSVMQGIT